MSLRHPKDPELHRLDRRDSLMWGVATLIMLALGVTVAIVYLAQIAASAVPLLPVPETRGLLAIGLCGILALFGLFALLKHHQVQNLRSQLIELRLLGQSLEARLFGLFSLLDGIAQVAMRLDLDAVLETLADHVRSSLHADQVSIMLLDPATDELECRAAAGRGIEPARGARIKVGHDIAGWIAMQNQTMVLNRGEMASRFLTHEKPERDIATALCVPLALKDRVIGVLNINRVGTASRFTSEDEQVVTVFAEHAAIAIQRLIETRRDKRVAVAEPPADDGSADMAA